MPKTPQLLATSERAFAGAIVTVVNLGTGETEVIHAKGYRYTTGTRRVDPRPLGAKPAREPNEKMKMHGLNDALRVLCAELEAREGDWRVRTISTPQSILLDIRGRKPGGGAVRPPNPDVYHLAMIGYPHLHERAT